MKNKPYVKEYDKNGNVTNAIKGEYLNYGPNRRTRRGDKNETPFIGNTNINRRKGIKINLTVVGDNKYYRVLQKIKCNILNNQKKVVGHWIKQVKHYLPDTINTLKRVNKVVE